MVRDALKTLFHPFGAGSLTAEDRGKVLFLGAEPGFVLPVGFSRDVHLVQGFRPDFLKLEASGLPVTPTIPDGAFDMVLVLASRHRGLNELNIADALERSVPGATIVVAGSKDDGIVSLRKRLEGVLEISGSAPKHHGVAFWFARPADALVVAAILRSENPDALVEGRFATRPGMFSFDRIDAGSRMLADALPASLTGHVGDFCAGWGYLSAVVAERCAGVTGIDLYEADFASLAAARLNVTPRADLALAFHWRDLMSEPTGERFDAIVMNPPFHVGRASDPSLGQAMIKAAAASMRKGAWLFMVANRRLPYESSLAASFTDVAEIAGDGAYKVLTARR